MNAEDRTFLTVNEVLKDVRTALKENKPFSLVRVGDGENIVLAQQTAMTVKQVLQTKWAIHANKGQKGVSLPDLKLRDELASGIQRADIVGIPFWNNDPIVADHNLKRELTEKVFRHLNIQPKRICHTFVNRVFAQKNEFWSLLKNKRVVLISSWAGPVSRILRKNPYKLNIVFTIDFKDNQQIKKTLKRMRKRKDDFDVVLLSCGVNAVILAPAIAEQTGKVALDFGKSLMFIVEEKAGLEHSSERANKNMIP
ncbi:MAG: hypothetical protein K0Q73_8893 [Paenibacillus sp.]|jgi:ribosome biogenesis protein Nip4|nr:hypothetical protein [Paenibacillus sp.]